MGFGRRMTNNETWLFFVGLTGRSRHCRRSSEWRLAEKVIINNVERISLLSLAACSYTNALFASLLSLHRLGTLYRCTHCNILHLNTTQHRMYYAPTSTGSTLQQRLRSSPVNALSLRHHLSKKKWLASISRVVVEEFRLFQSPFLDSVVLFQLFIYFYENSEAKKKSLIGTALVHAW